eukprot:gene14962-biopygen69
MEAGQKRSWQDMMAAPGSSRPARVPDQELMELYEANWMRESPTRLLPRQRVQQAAAVAAALTLQRQQQQQLIFTEPAFNDLADPLTGSDTHPAIDDLDFRPVWKRAWSKRMPRHLRYFTWRLLHAALPVGAARVKFIRAGNVEQLKQQCCQHPTCQALQPQPPLETLSHVFVQCPVAQQAWCWWQAMWHRLDPAAGLMPLDPHLLL